MIEAKSPDDDKPGGCRDDLDNGRKEKMRLELRTAPGIADSWQAPSPWPARALFTGSGNDPTSAATIPRRAQRWRGELSWLRHSGTT